MSIPSEGLRSAYARAAHGSFFEQNAFDNAIIIDPLQDDALKEKWRRHRLVSIRLSVDKNHPVPIVIDLSSLQDAKIAWVKKMGPSGPEINISSGKQHHPRIAPRGQPKKCIELAEIDGQKPIGIDVLIQSGQNPNPNVKDRYHVRLSPLYG